MKNSSARLKHRAFPRDDPLQKDEIMTIQPQQTRCARCGQELKIVEVRLPVRSNETVDLDTHPNGFMEVTRYETREEIADCPRCTGSF